MRRRQAEALKNFGPKMSFYRVSSHSVSFWASHCVCPLRQRYRQCIGTSVPSNSMRTRNSRYGTLRVTFEAIPCAETARKRISHPPPAESPSVSSAVVSARLTRREPPGSTGGHFPRTPRASDEASSSSSESHTFACRHATGRNRWEAGQQGDHEAHARLSRCACWRRSQRSGACCG